MKRRRDKTGREGHPHAIEENRIDKKSRTKQGTKDGKLYWLSESIGKWKSEDKPKLRHIPSSKIPTQEVQERKEHKIVRLIRLCIL